MRMICKKNHLQILHVITINLAMISSHINNNTFSKEFDFVSAEQMKIAGLTGNISTLDGETYLHLHIIAGRRDYSAVAGHLLSATLSGAGEFVVEDFGTEISRVHSSELGLNVYSL